ncbi:C6 transcription factor [Apiospora arundinis]
MELRDSTDLGLGYGLELNAQQQLPTISPSTLQTHQSQRIVQQQNDTCDATISIPYANSGTPDDNYLINLYYRHIHPAHPFLLPQKLYQQDRDVFPDHLKRAICFIASHHLSAYSDQHYAASNAVFESGVINDAFKVQSLILVTLASYARFERDRGSKALNAAINAAYQIGLNSENFARDGEPLFRESWRRTWWELYSIAGLISLIGGTNTRLSQPVDMTLPYDCEAYEACQTPGMGNVREIQERFTAEASTKWSSFAFRVEAVRILSMVLNSNEEIFSSKRLAAEAAISSWLLSLPEEKRDGLEADGEVDEVMSCALMIIHLAGICLHLPQSPLALVGDFKTVCGNDLGQVASEAPKVHQVAALRSAKALARLLTTRSNLNTLSPCFSCAVAYSAVVLLAEYSAQPRPRPLYLSEILQLQLSALQSLGQIWPIARVVRSQIAAFARDVMGKPSANSLSELSDLGSSPMDEQWLHDLITDNAILPD